MLSVSIQDYARNLLPKTMIGRPGTIPRNVFPGVFENTENPGGVSFIFILSSGI
jgi:hypothetical protein